MYKKRKYQWDTAKAESNFAKHGVVFEAVYDFDWGTVLTLDDQRWLYGENRFFSLGLIDHRLHTLIWTWREDYVRVISLRKANDRERKVYDTKIIHH